MNHHAAQARQLYLKRKHSTIQGRKQVAAQHLEQRRRGIEQLVGHPVTPGTAAQIHELWNAPKPAPSEEPAPSFDSMGRVTPAGYERIRQSARYEGDWSNPMAKVTYRL